MLLFTKEGAELTERFGGRLAADVYRRRHDRESVHSLRQMVRAALLEMQPVRLVQVMTMAGDARAVLEAFFILPKGPFSFRYTDALRPRDVWNEYRLRRYHDGYRYLLLQVILRAADADVLSIARMNRDVFRDEEMTLLRGGLRVVKAA